MILIQTTGKRELVAMEMEVVRSAEKTIRRHAKRQNKPCEYSYSR